MRLSKAELFGKLANATTQAGAALAFWGNQNEHPFKVVLTFNGESRRYLTYIWNITGGGNNRSLDEYRIQLTGVRDIEVLPGATTLLLGYYQGANVFAGWDAAKHLGSVSYSPSLQVHEDSLLEANKIGLALYPKRNDEVVVCCTPAFLLEYAISCTQLHGFTTLETQRAIAELVDASPDEAIHEPEVPEDRRRVIQIQARLHRAYDFRRRVLAAYQQTCAVSGTQLRLVDGAHIVPVNTPGSHDGTSNGICIDAIYHRAFDQGLLVILPDYTIGLDIGQIESATALGLGGGYERFLYGLRHVIALPAAKRDQPTPELLERAIGARGVDLNRVRSVADLQEV